MQKTNIFCKPSPQIVSTFLALFMSNRSFKSCLLLEWPRRTISVPWNGRWPSELQIKRFRRRVSTPWNCDLCEIVKARTILVVVKKKVYYSKNDWEGQSLSMKWRHVLRWQKMCTQITRERTRHRGSKMLFCKVAAISTTDTKRQPTPGQYKRTTINPARNILGVNFLK